MDVVGVEEMDLDITGVDTIVEIVSGWVVGAVETVSGWVVGAVKEELDRI